MKNTIERALEKQRQLQEETERQQLESECATAVEPMAPQSPPVTGSAAVAEKPANGSQAQAAFAHQQLHIDIDRLEKLGMVTPTENFSTIKEEYRYIKRPLLNSAFDNEDTPLKHANLVLVSSSFPGEGKTFTAINLAISIAMEQDRKVLLIDADFINPNICDRLGVEANIGLMDYLKGDATVAEIIQQTNIPNLKLIPAGNRTHHSNELLASDKMQALMSELSTRYVDRICLFDTAPILGASETNVLSQMTGQAVVVVEEERTTHGQLETALSLLNPNMAVGLVLNKSKKSRKEYYGYYYANSK